MKHKSPKPSHNTIFGKKGEDAIVAYLKQQGYQLLERNYKSNHGEIDIIVQKNTVIAFVEVKLRNRKTIALEQLISEQKQHKIEKTARMFIAQKNIALNATIFRFDVALVSCHENTLEYNYIESAFYSHE
jgi:putative endonuclease